MQNILIISSFVFLSFLCTGSDVTICPALHPTEKYARVDTTTRPCQNVRVVFYNTENLYDPYVDTTRPDVEFTSSGPRHWTYSRFMVKLNHLSKTLIAIGTREPPAIIGLCEVENRYVLNKLVYNTPLKKFNYRIIHRDSPDPRGIDVALLVRKDRIRVLATQFLRIDFPFDTSLKTREILYAELLVNSGDTLHLFVNHWPSRLGGYMVTNAKRNYVASILRRSVDSIMSAGHHPKILIMGDFNDGPGEESLQTILKAKGSTDPNDPDALVNLMIGKMHHLNEGTHKYQGEWNILDQFIVSGSLITSHSGLHTSEKDENIFRPDFLMEGDDKYFGSKPGRTYSGPRYLGGFSDHLPIWLDLHCEH